MIGRRTLFSVAGMAFLFRRRTALAQAESLVQQGGSPQNLATPTALFDRLIIPTPLFFVRSHFGPPALDPDRPLEVGGLVGTKMRWTVAELKRTFPEVTLTAVLGCTGNGRALHVPTVPGLQWVHGAVGQASFTGVRLRDILLKSGPSKEGAHVHLLGADAPPKPAVPAFLRSIPIDRALDPRTLVAWGMNGEDLTLAHGAPLRLIVPGWTGNHWVKWLHHVTVAEEEASGFFMKTAYCVPDSAENMRPLMAFPVKSIIASPSEGTHAPRGAQRVVGVAFSGEAAIAKVEVSIDEGRTWRMAKLEGPRSAGRWNVFRFEFQQIDPSRLRAVARATDEKGHVQPEHPAWNPSGYLWNGWHSVAWEVA